MQTFNLHKVWAVAQAERRLTRRLKRYWLFLVPAFAVALIYFVYLSAIHGVISSYSASVGMINPRFLPAVIVITFLALFFAGIIFLAFDVRARDQRERIAEAVDSRPLSNLEILSGRFLGLFLSAWIPIVVLCLLLQVLGWLLPMTGAPFGTTVEPWSLLGLATFLAIPTLTFMIALVFFITLLVRHRLLAALLSLSVLGGLFYATIAGPTGYIAFFDYAGTTFQSFSSDILPGISDAAGWFQRIGVLVLSLGLLGLAAAVHPRLDGGSRSRKAAVSGAICAIGLLGLLTAQLQRGDAVQRIADLREAHEARADEAFVDLLAVEGSISLLPGSGLEADLRLQISAPQDAPLSHALFTLNPGLVVESVLSDDGSSLESSHRDGLLEIMLPGGLAAGDSLTLQLRYGGRPDTRFAYLDSPLLPEDLPGQGDQALLGLSPALFDARYVALMPGVHWLPASGIDPGREDTSRRPRDYFNLDLQVEVPEGWIPAAPGRRERIRTSTPVRSTYRFAPPAPVPEVALLAAEFEVFSAAIGGVDFEMLLHPEHTGNMAVLAPLGEEIKQRIAQRLALLREGGLHYPYESFSVVEVPAALLGYRGGWLTDTALAPPGMALIKESGFPTARFDVELELPGNGNIDFSNLRKVEHVEADRLRDFFASDMTGSNIFHAFGRSLFSHQSSPVGRESAVLEYVMNQLAGMAVVGTRSYFSPYSFNQAIDSTINGLVQRFGEDSVAEAGIHVALQNVGLWTQAMDVSLVEMDPFEDPELSIDIYALKAGELVKSVHDALNTVGTSRLLASLLEDHRGGAYDIEDVQSALLEADVPDRMFSEMLYSTELPGFVAERSALFRLPDGEGGNPRYQLLLTIRNDEDVPGYVRALWYMPDEALPRRSNAIRVDGRGAVEYGVVLSRPPLTVHLDPYLSLNWSTFIVDRFEGEEIPRREASPFDGIRQIPWDDSSERVVTDDLDAGFTVLAMADDGSFQPVVPAPDEEQGLDHGLRVNFGMPAEWSRNITPTSWGRYRHTYAVARGGDGDRKAMMPSTLPHAGLWDLEIHLPQDQRTRGRLKLEIITAEGREAVEFDGSGRPLGWHLVGQYRLPAGEVKIEVSNETDAELAVADAFAWTPVNRAASR